MFPRFAAALLLLAMLVLAPARSDAHPDPLEEIEEATEALAAHPDHPDLWLDRAAEYLVAERYAEALSDVARAESLAPDRAEVPLLRGAIRLAQGLAAEAEREFTLAALRAPEGEDPYRLRGRARLALGRPREAAADFERCAALAHHPSPDDYLEWSRALTLPGAGSLEEAVAAVELGLSVLGGGAALVEEAIALDCERGAFDAALARVDRYPGAWGSAAARRARRGQVLRAAGRELEAEAEFSAALAELEQGRRRRGAAPAGLEARLRSALGQAP